MSPTKIIVSFTSLIKLMNSFNTPVNGEANDVYKVITTNYNLLVTWFRSLDELFVELAWFSFFFLHIVFIQYCFLVFIFVVRLLFFRCRFLVYFSFSYQADFFLWIHFVNFFVWSVFIQQVVAFTADGFLFILKYWDILWTLGWYSCLYFVWSSNGARRPSGV